MKKLLTLFASLIVCASASAQFTIVGGLTTSADKSAGRFSIENINQFHVGVGNCTRLGLFAILPVLEYNRKGMSYRELQDGHTYVRQRTGYLELPVQFQLNLPLIPRLINLMAVGEPYISYAVHREEQIDYSPWEKMTDWSGISRFRYGVGLGGGVELFRHLQLTVRYFWDFAGSEFDSLVKIPSQIIDNKASGIKFSAAIVF